VAPRCRDDDCVLRTVGRHRLPALRLRPDRPPRTTMSRVDERERRRSISSRMDGSR
jgi:hypothetical protein